MSFYTLFPSRTCLVWNLNHHMKFSVLYYINELEIWRLWTYLDLASLLCLLILNLVALVFFLSYAKFFPVLRPCLWASFSPKFSALAPSPPLACSSDVVFSETFLGHPFQSSSKLYSCFYPYIWLYCLHSIYHYMKLPPSFVCLFYPLNLICPPLSLAWEVQERRLIF